MGPARALALPRLNLQSATCNLQFQLAQLGMGNVLIVCRPGAASITFGMELTVIEAVATSPCTPPAIFIASFGVPSMSTESYDSGAPRYASMWSVMIGVPPT